MEQFGRVIEGGSVRHESSRSYDSAEMRFKNGAIDALRQTKVIRIDNQLSHTTEFSSGKLGASNQAPALAGIMGVRGRGLDTICW